jgi:hypothetical protein
MGWGRYIPRKKTKEQLAVERRRELAKQFPGTLEELQAIAARTRVKVKRLPAAPHRDDIITDSAPPSVVGSCQQHVAHMKAWHAAKSPGRVAVLEDEPYVSEREKKLQAGREYHRRRYKSKRKAKKCP